VSGLSITYIGGPTAYLDYAGLRFLTDPTFDPAGTEYPTPVYTLRKIQGPVHATPEAAADVVLLSHEHHFDNLDHAGRKALVSAPLVLTTRDGAERLKGSALGLNLWESLEVPAPRTGKVVRITATPCRHGPPGGDRGPVIGFILQTTDNSSPVVYVSGDTVLFEGVIEVGRRFRIDVALLNLGAAKVAVAGPMPLTFTAEEGAELSKLWPETRFIPLHYEGWQHFSEGRAEIEQAFARTGSSSRLSWPVSGTPYEVPIR
jgi:L-ascorbate metabolism protein UlaG (beta-lactamase superfamily)